MKTIKSISLVIFLLIGNYVSGQDYSLSITGNAGVSISDIRIKDAKTDSRFGFRGGIGLEINLPRNFFLQTGLDFAMKGAESKQFLTGDLNGDGITGDFYMSQEKINASYLILPVKAGYRLSFSEAVRLNFSLGPYFGYGIGGKYEGGEAFLAHLQNDDPVLSENQVSAQYRGFSGDTFSKEALKRFDMGLAVKAGIEYKRILLDLGYEYGFTNNSKGNSSSYNNSLFLTLGYRIF